MRYSTKLAPSGEMTLNINLKLEIVGDKSIKVSAVQTEEETQKEETNWAIPSFENVQKLTNFGKEIK